MSSTRKFVNTMRHQDQVNEVYMAADKQLRPNRNGNLYLQIELSDRSGSIAARLWNASEKDYENFENGDYVRVEGATQLFQGNMQMIASSICKVPASEVDDNDFIVLGGQEIDQLATRLGEILREVKSPHLRTLAECFLMDEPFMAKFTRAPAGIKNHHAYHGGLVEHVTNLMELILRIADRYPELDADLMLLGAFLHDAGKVDELSYERELAYTDQGQLLGHIVLGVAMLDNKIAEAQQLSGEPIPEELVLQLKHIIVSHHGQREFGSPTVPMTLEAVALHHLDNLDAKLHQFGQLIRDDANSENNWTQYHPNLGRKLYKAPRSPNS